MNTEIKNLDGLELSEWINILDRTVKKFGKEQVSGLGKTIDIKKELLVELNYIKLLDEYNYIYTNVYGKVLQKSNDDCYYYDLSTRINKVIIGNIDIYNNIELGNFEETWNGTRYKKVNTANNQFKKIWNKEIKSLKKMKEQKTHNIGNKVKFKSFGEDLEFEVIEKEDGMTVYHYQDAA